MIVLKNGQIHITDLGHKEAANLAMRYILSNLCVTEQQLIENTVVSTNSVTYDDGVQFMKIAIDS